MKLWLGTNSLAAFSLAALAGLFTTPAWAANDPATGDPLVGEAVVEVEPIELLGAEALQTLVAPVALYPDDLLAVVLPASTYPLQVVLAARFLEDGQQNADEDAAQPSEEWDDAVVALLNYPEVVALMDNNLDWTRRLGEAVIVQEEDVIAAISAFREQAKDAGNLESDGKQDVVVNDAGAIEIKPAVPEEIYVPYYEPEEVVVRQPVRVYHYYPRSYPVYYYPYHRDYSFAHGPFWGVTSAFSIGWHTRNLHLHHYGFLDHPYYSYRYYDPFYYRRPHLVLNVYDRDRRHRHRHRSDRHHRGNDWRSERSKRDHRRWTAGNDGRRGKGRWNDRRRGASPDEGRHRQSDGGGQQQWTARGERPRGERRGEDRRPGDRQRRAQREHGESIAQTLKTGATAPVHRPTQITPLGEVQPRPTSNRTGIRGAQAGAPAAEPSLRQRAGRQPAQRGRAERHREIARVPQSGSQTAAPTATRPVQRPNRAQPTRQAQRPASPTRPAAIQARGNANTPHQVRQSQRVERRAQERMAPRTPARPQSPRALPNRASQRADRAPQRANRAPPPRTQRPIAANRPAERPTARQPVRQVRPQPNLNRGAPPRVQQSAPAARQAPQQMSQPRFHRQAPGRAERPAAPVRPARVERRSEPPAPQRPVRSRPGPSGDDFRSRRPR